VRDVSEVEMQAKRGRGGNDAVAVEDHELAV
jgi:hypothetical protein